MRPKDIIEFVKKYVEPLPAYPPYGERYRVSAMMTDGTSLPCVVIESAPRIIDLALKRFEETRTSLDPYSGYRAIVNSFVTSGNRVNDYDLKQLAISPYAMPPSRIQEIKGGTSMGWTGFCVRMKDGMEFRFGTTFLVEFFDMPPGYSAADILRVFPEVHGEEEKQKRVYREKPFFTCYLNGL